MRALLARHERECAALASVKNDFFRVWRDCPNKQCLRARRCAGEPHDCIHFVWATLPEDLRILYRTAAAACAQGHSRGEAERLGRAAAVRWIERQCAKADGMLS